MGVAWLRPLLTALDVAAAAVAVVLAWRIRRGAARWPVALTLAWLLFEAAAKATGRSPAGAVLDLFLAIVAARALGAAQALYAGRKDRIDPQVF